jgi:serine/threonine protein kinase
MTKLTILDVTGQGLLEHNTYPGLQTLGIPTIAERARLLNAFKKITGNSRNLSPGLSNVSPSRAPQFPMRRRKQESANFDDFDSNHDDIASPITPTSVPSLSSPSYKPKFRRSRDPNSPTSTHYSGSLLSRTGSGTFRQFLDPEVEDGYIEAETPKLDPQQALLEHAARLNAGSASSLPPIAFGSPLLPSSQSTIPHVSSSLPNIPSIPSSPIRSTSLTNTPSLATNVGSMSLSRRRVQLPDASMPPPVITPRSSSIKGPVTRALDVSPDKPSLDKPAMDKVPMDKPSMDKHPMDKPERPLLDKPTRTFSFHTQTSKHAVILEMDDLRNSPMFKKEVFSAMGITPEEQVEWAVFAIEEAHGSRVIDDVELYEIMGETGHPMNGYLVIAPRSQPPSDIPKETRTSLRVKIGTQNGMPVVSVTEQTNEKLEAPLQKSRSIKKVRMHEENSSRPKSISPGRGATGRKSPSRKSRSPSPADNASAPIRLGRSSTTKDRQKNGGLTPFGTLGRKQPSNISSSVFYSMPRPHILGVHRKGVTGPLGEADQGTLSRGPSSRTLGRRNSQSTSQTLGRSKSRRLDVPLQERPTSEFMASRLPTYFPQLDPSLEHPPETEEFAPPVYVPSGGLPTPPIAPPDLPAPAPPVELNAPLMFVHDAASLAPSRIISSDSQSVASQADSDPNPSHDSIVSGDGHKSLKAIIDANLRRSASVKQDTLQRRQSQKQKTIFQIVQQTMGAMSKSAPFRTLPRRRDSKASIDSVKSVDTEDSRKRDRRSQLVLENRLSTATTGTDGAVEDIVDSYGQDTDDYFSRTATLDRRDDQLLYEHSDHLMVHTPAFMTPAPPVPFEMIPEDDSDGSDMSFHAGDDLIQQSEGATILPTTEPSTTHTSANASRQTSPGRNTMEIRLDATKINWLKGELIGKGSFGSVYHGLNLDTGEFMAVKQVVFVQPRKMENDSVAAKRRKLVEALQNEISLLKELDHENIVKYLGCEVSDDFINVFLEYVPGGSISSMLYKIGSFDEPLVRSAVYQILLGLDYLHRRGIMHRDIKGANILIDNEGTAKISDFGISKRNEYQMAYRFNSRMSLQGSVYWMAPEVIKSKGYSAKVDIWSLGCLVLEMFTGHHPWRQYDEVAALYRLGQSTNPTPPIPPDLSPEAQDFLDKCFTIDPEMRPTAEDLLKHPFCHLDDNFNFAEYMQMLEERDMDDDEYYSDEYEYDEEYDEEYEEQGEYEMDQALKMMDGHVETETLHPNVTLEQDFVPATPVASHFVPLQVVPQLTVNVNLQVPGMPSDLDTSPTTPTAQSHS